MSNQRHPLLGKRLKDDAKITLLLVPEGDDPVSPQMREILFAIDDNGGTVLFGELLEILGKVLDTKQQPRKVWKFYRRTLLADGWISIEQ